MPNWQKGSCMLATYLSVWIAGAHISVCSTLCMVSLRMLEALTDLGFRV